MVEEVNASLKTVWDVLMDSSYVARLYPDVISVEADPPGPNFVGQKFHIIGRAGRRKLEIFAETTEQVPMTKVVTRQRPGGLFKSFESVVILEANSAGTAAKISFEYELSLGYIGKVFNIVLLERLVSDNLKAYTKNLKEVCELLPLP